MQQPINPAALLGNSVIEVRAFSKTGRKRIFSGYFDDPQAAYNAAMHFDGKVDVYLSLNEPNRDLMARFNAGEVVEVGSGDTTSDGNIVRRRWLLLDADPVRTSKISSTDAEKVEALAILDAIKKDLDGKGWPEPVICDSGNGYHLLYRIDLPNDEESTELVKNVLRSFSSRFSTERVKLDETVFNASRITKFYGVMTMKGKNTPERPHRRSRVVYVPPNLSPVPTELLRAEVPADEPKTLAPARSPSRGSLDLQDFFQKHNIQIVKAEKAPRGGVKYILSECPFNPEHTAPDAAVFQQPDGKLGFKCLHDSCSKKTWRDFRLHFEPNAYSKKGKDTVSMMQKAQAAFQAEEIPAELENLSDRPVTLEVVRSALGLLNISVRYNLILNDVDIEGLPSQYSQQNAVNVLPVVLRDKFREAGATCTKADVEDGVMAIADECRYNPVQDMLNMVQWDGFDRLPIICEILGVDSPDRRTYIRKWLIQCIAMALNDERNAMGADGVLVLLGAQGGGKTTFFRVLALRPDWFVEGASINTDNKDTIIKATGAWICELGELDGTLKRDQPALKAHITAAYDIIRAPYGKVATRRPRHTSYCGTVNGSDYLRDDTGNRRFWTVPVSHIDLDRLFSLSKEWIMQLWAQANEAYQADHNAFRLTPAERATLEESNAAYAKMLPGEQEIRDIFDFSLPRERWGMFTASQISSRTINSYKLTAEQVGRILRKLQRECPGIEQMTSRKQGKRFWTVPLPQDYGAFNDGEWGDSGGQ